MDDVLKQAMSLIIAGNKKSASELLASVVRSDPKNEMAWLYLSYCVAANDQIEFCLKKTLEINPNNQQAKQALSDMKIRNQASSISNVSQQLPTQSQPNQQKVSPRPSPKKSNNLVPVLVAGSVLVIALVVLLVLVFWGLSKTGILSQLQLPSIVAAQPKEITASPAKTYSDQMIPILAQLNLYNATLNQWDTLMATGTSIQDPDAGYTTYASGLMFYLTFSKFSDAGVQKYAPFNQEIKSKVLPLAQKISSDGFNLQTAWNSVAPPPDVGLPHKQIGSCIQSKIDLANGIIAMLTQYTTPASVSIPDPCANYQDALSAIQTYVNNNR